MGRRIDRRRPVLGLRICLGAGVALKAPFGGGIGKLYQTVDASIGFDSSNVPSLIGCRRPGAGHRSFAALLLFSHFPRVPCFRARPRGVRPRGCRQVSGDSGSLSGLLSTMAGPCVLDGPFLVDFRAWFGPLCTMGLANVLYGPFLGPAWLLFALLAPVPATFSSHFV